MVEKKEPKCGKCGATGVRIYRDYGMFRRPEEDRCNDCTENHSGVVPCILDDDGEAWGFTSVPELACERFYALPEKNKKKKYWKIKNDGTTNWTEPEIVDEELIEQTVRGKTW